MAHGLADSLGALAAGNEVGGVGGADVVDVDTFDPAPLAGGFPKRLDDRLMPLSILAGEDVLRTRQSLLSKRRLTAALFGWPSSS